MTLSFDTLQFVQRLKQSGMEEAQAEAVARAVREIQVTESPELATKNDIARLEVKIAETRADLVKWVVSVGVLQTAIIAALLMKLIPA